MWTVPPSAIVRASRRTRTCCLTAGASLRQASTSPAAISRKNGHRPGQESGGGRLRRLQRGGREHHLASTRSGSGNSFRSRRFSTAWHSAATGRTFYVSGGDSGMIYVFDYADGKASLEGAGAAPRREQVARFSGRHRRASGHGALYVCNEANHEIWVLSPNTLQVEKTIDRWATSALLRVGRRRPASVRQQLGQPQRQHHRHQGQARTSATSPSACGPTTWRSRPTAGCSWPARATTRCTSSRRPSWKRPVRRPSPTRRLPEGTREIISTSLYPQSPEGSTPCGVAVSPDGKTLFVANADNNAVMVVDISGRLSEEAKEHGETISLVNGFIPTGWYPTAVAVSPDNQFLLVANGKGLASRASCPPRTQVAEQAAHGHPVRSTRPDCSKARSRSSPSPTRGRWPPTPRRCAAIRPIIPSTSRRRRLQAIRSFPRRSATPARSSTCSTSSRRTAPTTRSSAT